MKRIYIIVIILTTALISGCSANNIRYTGSGNPIIIDTENISYPLISDFTIPSEIRGQVDFSVDDNRIAYLDSNNILYGAMNGTTTVRVSYGRFSQEIPLIINLDLDEVELGINQLTPSFNFILSDNSGFNRRTITTNGIDVAVYYEDIRIAVINEETSFEAIYPGTYEFKYRNLLGNLFTHGSYTILDPNIEYDPSENIIRILTPTDYLRASLNGEPLFIQETIDTSAFGNYDIDFYFHDYNNNRNVIKNLEFTTELTFNRDLGNSLVLQVQSPLRIRFDNEVQEVLVNRRSTNLNSNNELLIRNTGLNTIEIRGLGGATRIYRVRYINELMEDILQFWPVFIPFSVLTAGTLTLKVIKGVRK